jgi:toxin YoeB
MRDITFADDAFEEYLTWLNQDKKTWRKINKLIKDIQRDPFSGEGKPEALSGDLSGKWSRRINEKDRLVYSASDDTFIIYQCKGHYSDK